MGYKSVRLPGETPKSARPLIATAVGNVLLGKARLDIDPSLPHTSTSETEPPPALDPDRPAGGDFVVNGVQLGYVNKANQAKPHLKIVNKR